MRRVVSVWFPHWATDRLRRHRGTPPAEGLAAIPEHGVPLVTAWHDGRRRVVAVVDKAAGRLGLRSGMAVAHALAMIPDLHVAESEPEADAGALHRLALWCRRYTPLVSACPPDGLWLDVGGSAHLFGGEEALLTHLLDRLARDGLQASGAAADTPGAAHALARHRTAAGGGGNAVVVPPGGQMAAVAALPVSCLRLAPELDTTLRRLGFEQVRHLGRIPRALLARRFGPVVGLRLDQAQGTVHESLTPLPPDQVLHRREGFLEPLVTADALAIAIERLVGPLCLEMEGAGLGARRLDLLFERIDNQVVALRVGTARPSRDAGHLVRLLGERLDTVEPGPGIEAMQLIVPLAEPLRWEQQDSGAGPQDVARLVDRLSNRLGNERVYRAASVEATVPEDLVRKGSVFERGARHAAVGVGTVDHVAPVAAATVEPLRTPPCPVLTLVASTPGVAAAARTQPPREHPGLRLVSGVGGGGAQDDDGSDDGTDAGADDGAGAVVLPWKPRHDTHRPVAVEPLADGPRHRGHRHPAWPSHLHPPARLLAPPRPVAAIAALPDGAPAVFTWRRSHKVVRSEGPERVHERWWNGDHETDAIRDYFQVEVEGGQRFWLFRRGNGMDRRTGDLSWFLHGVF